MVGSLHPKKTVNPCLTATVFVCIVYLLHVAILRGKATSYVLSSIASMDIKAGELAEERLKQFFSEVELQQQQKWRKGDSSAYQRLADM